MSAPPVGAGARSLMAPYDAFWGARFAVVEDPEGNAVGIMSPMDDARRTAPPDIDFLGPVYRGVGQAVAERGGGHRHEGDREDGDGQQTDGVDQQLHARIMRTGCDRNASAGAQPRTSIDIPRRALARSIAANEW
jgi:hypothetical protein